MMSASVPMSSEPFSGYMPKIFAGFVETNSTNRLKSMRSAFTPLVNRRGSRVSMPGSPLGIRVKLSLPRVF